jgi:DNA invertase Pin-like site-specific DNA recombinase
MNGKFIAYYRVSTQKQGQSGLGLEAQQNAVVAYLNGGNWEVLNEYVEVESGKNSNRAQLAAAIAECKKEKATLVIAKLDRLARNVHFISGLMESGVDFIAADNPHANRLTVQILAAVAEDEARRISERTKAALAVAKARGVKLGANGHKLAAVNRKAANDTAATLSPVVEKIRRAGHETVKEITAELNRREVPTARGGQWHPTSTQRLLKRLAA